MTWNGNGVFDPPGTPEFPAIAGDVIRAEYFNTVIQALCDAFLNTLPRDGQAPATANLPMGGFKLTGLAAANANGEAVRYNEYTAAVAGVDADITALEAAVLALQGLPSFAFTQRTSDTIFTSTDAGKLIEYTSGTFTQTFNPIAGFSTYWYITLKNSGTGIITLNPNAGETIDGLTSFPMFPGEQRTIVKSGSNYVSFVTAPYHYDFTTVGANTWTKPPGYARHSGILINGGSSGAKDTGVNLARGGGGGGAFPFTIPSALLGATETVTVGAGGAAVTTAATAGNPGGASSFGSLVVMSALGAGSADQGSSYNSATSTIAVGFEATTSGTSPSQKVIWGGGTPSSDSTAQAGSSLYGGGAGAGVNWTTGIPNAPGTSKMAGNGGAGSDAGVAGSGVAPGGGGGGTKTGTSGAGARGEVRVWGEI